MKLSLIAFLSNILLCWEARKLLKLQKTMDLSTIWFAKFIHRCSINYQIPVRVMLVKSDESQLTYLAKYYGFWALNELIFSVRKSWGRLLIFTLILEKQNQFFFFLFFKDPRIKNWRYYSSKLMRYELRTYNNLNSLLVMKHNSPKTLDS